LIVSLAAIIDMIAKFDIIVNNDGHQPMLTRDNSARARTAGCRTTDVGQNKIAAISIIGDQAKSPRYRRVLGCSHIFE
jgi:hypothetical protein